MSSNSKKQSKNEPLILTRNNFFHSIIRYLVSGWRTYIGLMTWATVVVFVIFLFTGEIFTRNGLIFLIIISLPVLLYYLDKWLEKQD
jgi:hypothetical protein